MFDHIEDHNKRVYYAMIKNLDDSVGEIKKTLEREGILDNTLIIFLQVTMEEQRILEQLTTRPTLEKKCPILRRNCSSYDDAME